MGSYLKTVKAFVAARLDCTASEERSKLNSELRFNCRQFTSREERKSLWRRVSWCGAHTCWKKKSCSQSNIFFCSFNFFQAWRRYDTDRSGYIEANELKVGRPDQKYNKMPIIHLPDGPIYPHFSFLLFFYPHHTFQRTSTQSYIITNRETKQ